MDTSGSEDHPQAAGHPTHTTDAPPPAAPEPALPHPRLTSYAGAGAGAAPPVPPAQIAASLDRTDREIKESIKTTQRDDDAPVPPAQIATNLEGIDAAIKGLLKTPPDAPDAEDAPMPPSQIAAGFHETEIAIKENVKNANSSGSGMDPPLAPSQMAALAEEMVEDDEEYGLKKKAAPTTETDGDTPSSSLLVMPSTAEEEKTLQRAQDPPIPAVARAPSRPPTDQGRSPPNPRVQQQLPIRPPPPSMMPSPDEDADPPVSDLPRDPSMHMVEATLVEEQPEIPVYDAIQVAEQTRMKKYKKYIFGGLGILFGTAVTAGVTVSSNNGSSDSNTTEPESSPSDSSSPSDVPSLRPTLRPSTAPPSESSSPSRYPSVRPTLRPSQFPSASFQPSESIVPSQSLRPSFWPSNSFSPSTYWSTLNWSRQGLGFNGDASDDRFGQAVAFSADALTMAIGAPRRDFGGNDDRPGYVKVYGREEEGSSWEQRGDTIRGKANGDLFGVSLALSEDGTTLSIGAPRHDSVGPDSGQVKVYEWDEAALDYVQIGGTLYGAASSDRFGHSLDISNGKILVVGGPTSNANGILSGQVTVYAWDSASSNFKQRGEAINGDAFGWFGYSVSLTGNGQKLAIGAPFGINEGQVRVFEWDEAASNYKQLGDSLLADAAGDLFGWSVSFSHDGSTLAVVAPGQESGQVKVFAWDEAASNFVQIGQSLYGKAPRDEFGISVSLSSEGKTLAVGASQPFADKPGYVEVYERDESASEYKRLGQSLGGEASGDGFGFALALAGNGRDLAVGASYNDRNGTDSGRVEVFEIEL